MVKLNRIDDPTYDEMREYLAYIMPFEDDDFEEFALEEAIYWFAHDYHSGQASNLYSVLSTSMFKPGAYSTGISDDEITIDYYNHLVEQYGEGIVPGSHSKE